MQCICIVKLASLSCKFCSSILTQRERNCTTSVTRTNLFYLFRWHSPPSPKTVDSYCLSYCFIFVLCSRRYVHVNELQRPVLRKSSLHENTQNFKTLGVSLTKIRYLGLSEYTRILDFLQKQFLKYYKMHFNRQKSYKILDFEHRL